LCRWLIPLSYLTLKKNILPSKQACVWYVDISFILYRVVQFNISPQGTEKAGPVITDNGNFVIDAHFGPISSPGELASQLKLMPGIIEVGLFCNMVEKAYFGSADGSVNIQAKK
jgi:ribose 5-phosphate isomerase